MARKLVMGVAIFVVLIGSVSLAADRSKEKEAVAAAGKWLALVDAGKNAESWKEAAEYFKTAVSQEKWEQSLQAVRKPLGKTISRKLKTEAYRTSLPGAPDGEYVVIQFETSFQHKKAAVETVTPMLDKDG